MESIYMYFNIYPTDATFVVIDSLHSCGKEFLIEGDGWKLLSQLQYQKKITVPGTIWESDPIYEKVHDIFLAGLDADDLEEF